MIRVRGRAATYGEVWFDESPPADPGVDILVYRQHSVPIDNARNVPTLSLVSDLSGDDEALAATFSKECRYEIRRADGKDGNAYEFIAKPWAHLAEFSAFYTAFAEQKALPATDTQWLRAACADGSLLFTTVRRAGEPLVWHAYLHRAGVARLLHSASHLGFRDSGSRALVGRANRWLHWKDMLRLKALGLTCYDWGGMFEDEAEPGRAGINRFKRSFGGRPVRLYDCTMAVSLRGRIYLPLRDAWRSWNGRGAHNRSREATCQPC